MASLLVLLIILHGTARGFLYVRFGLVLPRGLMVSIILDVARSKFRQRQYFNTVYSYCFIIVTNAFFNILIDYGGP